ncbi:hypothetical protein TTHERM_00825140 (macronuclear) [Tetrahymena thermophila SB210]|uniref:Uncharacterized protein n=1 Tax=Tetrahymena thermophila (strain SB210) TaxID=312017 RepID=I7LZE2_TETTS|nr:hypothetical protein TTHERM_00825140 [Tetrahymena thermophila SB210]EAR83719.3 hypothetical protein TTHERM_00825140 [Tetrahymena thermophila SB210]|eukprot:XP_001031382.3 hypothetical protein TTHERM_00825140 [Tetrahymena thermophila SB210]
MWNVISGNEYLKQKNTTHNQKRHLINIIGARPAITNDLPWYPSHSLSKNTNKFSIQRNIKVFNDNQVLLKKMMEIDQKDAQLSQKKLSKSFQMHKIKSSAEYVRKSNEKFIGIENQKMLQRIVSQKSVYQNKDFKKQNLQANLYKQNISRQNKKYNLDYTILAKKELLSDSAFIRRSSLSTQAYSSFSKSPILMALNSKKNENAKDFIDFPIL